MPITLMSNVANNSNKLALYKTNKNILECTTNMLNEGKVVMNLAVNKEIIVNNKKQYKREAMYSAYLDIAEAKTLLTSIINGTMLGLREEILATNPKFGSMYFTRGGNKTTYRYLAIKPGTSGDIKYRVEIGEGEGEQDDEGKINPKKGVKIPYAVVGLTHWDMVAFATEALEKLDCYIQEQLQMGYDPFNPKNNK